MKTLSFNDLSKFGLVFLVNKKVLHPLGLALMWDPEENASTGVLIAPDLKFEYSEKQIRRNEGRLQAFLESRKEILKNRLNEEYNEYEEWLFIQHRENVLRNRKQEATRKFRIRVADMLERETGSKDVDILEITIKENGVMVDYVIDVFSEDVYTKFYERKEVEKILKEIQ